MYQNTFLYVLYGPIDSIKFVENIGKVPKIELVAISAWKTNSKVELDETNAPKKTSTGLQRYINC